MPLPALCDFWYAATSNTLTYLSTKSSLSNVRYSGDDGHVVTRRWVVSSSPPRTCDRGLDPVAAVAGSSRWMLWSLAHRSAADEISSSTPVSSTITSPPTVCAITTEFLRSFLAKSTARCVLVVVVVVVVGSPRNASALDAPSSGSFIYRSNNSSVWAVPAHTCSCRQWC